MNEAKETNRERARRVAKAIAAGGVPKQITDEATPEEIAADKRRSLALLAASGASLSADDMELAFAIQRETNARANIDVLSDQIIALWFDNRPKDIEVLKEQLHVQTVALARALRDQGRLDEAVEVLPEYAEKLAVGREAIERPDDWECECSDIMLATFDASGREQTKIVSKWHVMKRIQSAKHGGPVYLLQCQGCGVLNARPDLPARLYAQIAVATDPKNVPEGRGSDMDVLPYA